VSGLFSFTGQQGQHFGSVIAQRGFKQKRVARQRTQLTANTHPTKCIVADVKYFADFFCAHVFNLLHIMTNCTRKGCIIV
jgi:hypothetical protein